MKTIAFLLSKGADPNIKDNNGDTALSETTFWDYFDCAKLLIDNGADIHARDNDGVTILMGAAGESSPEFVEYLINKGARVNEVDNEGESVLMWAVKETIPNEKIVRTLLENGADKTVNNNIGESVLDVLDEDDEDEAIIIRLLTKA